MVPALNPRYFSISSSLRAHPGRAHVLAAVVDYRTPLRRRRRGVCTTWLAGLVPARLGPAQHGVAQRTPALRSSSGGAAYSGGCPPSLAESESRGADANGASVRDGSAACAALRNGGGGGGPRVPVWVKRGTMRLPPPSVPLILVGPGTGVAPFLAFLEERLAALDAG